MKKERKSRTSQKGNSQKKIAGGKKLINNILPLIPVLVIVFVIIGGTFYMLIHFNINNFGENYRELLQDKPLFAWMLPHGEDPDDPKYMTGVEVRSKYRELKGENESLKNQLIEAEETIQELAAYKNETQKILGEIEERRKKLDKDINEFEIMVVSNNESGFRQYFEQVDPETAAILYSEIVKKQEAQAELKNIAEVYESMNCKSAATIINEMGLEKLDFIVSIFNVMEIDTVAEIMALMDTKLATHVTESMCTIND